MALTIHVPPHPFIANLLAVCRDSATPVPIFRSAVADLGRWLTYECVRDWLPTLEVGVRTPLEVIAAARIIDANAPVAIVPILRAGLALLDGVLPLLPAAPVYHLGYARDEETLEANCYLDRLPERFAPQTRVLVLEPMLATGGTSLAAMAKLIERGVDPALVRILSIICAPAALQKLGGRYPSLVIYTAMIDEALDERGFIVPGLGDAGDRAFGTAYPPGVG
ncbi:uracil phosphoribosyltransferase [Gloeobacter kilaueensis]|uniref:Uracil phosphoribosyltransferase n=1 Tax=Gloeobacter kilaueensis (strain ATCC BAA-2537 / CCAP 1431/1 / ULC 316 / JS1) TaxID=1183438 RepID=U5QKR1_GLOK1|nr:uracil phosphoribosyltransferase [Gloeobacter kilaueensis]AGY59448.1 uracil phosphoribosyltransferase [Gloeobacter kilaueensis JS1]